MTRISIVDKLTQTNLSTSIINSIGRETICLVYRIKEIVWALGGQLPLPREKNGKSCLFNGPKRQCSTPQPSSLEPSTLLEVQWVLNVRPEPLVATYMSNNEQYE
jgi:hypothetical protein